MKRVLLSLLFIYITASLLAQRPQTEHYLDPYNPEFVQGEILLKFKDEVEITLPKSGTKSKTGISAIDNILKNQSVTSIAKVFRTSDRQTQRQTVRFPNGEEKQVPALYNIYRIKLDSKADILALTDEMTEVPEVEYAEPNYLVYSMGDAGPAGGEKKDKQNKSTNNFTPNDPLLGDMWHINAVNAPAAWDSTGGSGQVIGIIDTGVDWDHPDLDDNIWTNTNEIAGNGIDDDGNGYIDDIRGWDYINDDNDPNDDNSHGTHVAGIAAAEGNNGTGVIGIAYQAKIMCLKVLQSSGTGNSADLADAIEYASQNGATVINMSLGSYGESLTVKSALEVAYSTSLPVAAAGNDGFPIETACDIPGNIIYPAAYSFVLGTLASQQYSNDNGCPLKPDILASFSNFDPSGPIGSTHDGDNYEVIAPGTNIMSSFPNGSYHNLSGTSMASPIVAGAVALMQEFKPAQSKEEIFARLIQSANGGPINIASALNDTLHPDLYYVDYTLLDTCPGCDNDGAPDAGETIDLYLTVKNVGGLADSVWSKFRFGPFEDTTVANIIDSTGYIGDISAYATLTGELDHFRITIDSNVVNGRDIVFNYEIGCGNSGSNPSGQITLTTQNGTELLGVMDTTLTLTADKLWLINNSFQVGPNGILNINPNTTLIINKPLISYGEINMNGAKDSTIYITSTNFDNTYQYFISSLKINAKYVTFEGLENSNILSKLMVIGSFGDNQSSGIFEKVHFKSININFYLFQNNYSNNPMRFTDCIFKNIKCADFGGSSTIHYNNFNNITFSEGNFNIGKRNKFNNYSLFSITNTQPQCAITYTNVADFQYNNYLSTNCLYSTISGPGIDYVDSMFWGTYNNDTIQKRIYDFFDNPSYKQLDLSKKLFMPSDSAHGCVWKVEIDGIDPQDEVLDPLGAGTYQFDVYFNKCMDTSYTPGLSFGVRDPHTQHFVTDNSYWSADSTKWTAFYDIGIETGDGINYIRVTGAVDTAGFEIPTEDNERFTFVIQAASAASTEFIATAGIGKVDLEWPTGNTDDVLGYNLYRYFFIDSVTTTDSVRINDELIVDTVFTDYDVIPDTTYHYFYKILGTDLAESDRSKIMSATPFNAANGDANGDLSVDVLDITTIVSYLLNQNPSPFLTDAADVNYDNQINVLDIIGVVSLISGSSPNAKFIRVVSEADLYLNDGEISVAGNERIAALQFTLYAENASMLHLYSTIEGFELAWVQDENTITGVIYSFDNKTIEGDFHKLIRIEGESSSIKWGPAIGGDPAGNYIKINTHTGMPEKPLVFDLLAVHPNPFSNEVNIDFQLPEVQEITLCIYSMDGRLVEELRNGKMDSGYYTAQWDGKNLEGKKMPNGVYLCSLQGKSADGLLKRKDLKIILLR